MERFFSLILPSKSRLPQLCIPPPVASNNRKQSLPISRLNRPIFKSAAPTLHEPPHSFYEPLSQSNEVKAQIEIPPVEKQRVLKIVIMGCANAGKSTLLNYLMERKISPVSSKAQTTRSIVHGILTTDATQLIFLDLPGISSDDKKIKLPKTLIESAWYPVEESNYSPSSSSVPEHVLFVVDASKTSFEMDFKILDKVSQSPHVMNHTLTLVLNKSDKIASSSPSLTSIVKESFMESYSKLINRSFVVCARNPSTLCSLKKYLNSLSMPGPWEYHDPLINSNLSKDEFVMEAIREKLYKRLNKEVPYLIQQELLSWNEQLDACSAHVILKVPHPKYKKIVIGKDGSALKWIQEASEREISKEFGKVIKLNFHVTSVKK